MTELRSHPHLTLAQHLDQIRAAAHAIWGRHSGELLARCGAARSIFEDAVCLHDTGKASKAFQQYIPAPDKYRGPKDRKAHTPLSTVLTLLHGPQAGWEWRRTLSVALIACGHHSSFKTCKELDEFTGWGHIIHQQIADLDWDALERAVGLPLPRLEGRDGDDVVTEASDQLALLIEELHALSTDEGVCYRLLCQLAFSVLLEADKAYLAIPEQDVPEYLLCRSADLPARLVEGYIAGKAATPLNDLRQTARAAMTEGLGRTGESRVHTMTLPTGTGKTLLGASWALTLRDRLKEAGPPPLVVIVLPYLAIIDQTVKEYRELLGGHVLAGELITYHSLSDRTFDQALEGESQDFFLDTWQSDVVITTFDQLLFALLSPKARHQMRFHHLTDALIVMDEVQALPCVLWDPLRRVLDGLTRMGTTRILAMSATQPRFLPEARELIDQPEAFFARMGRYRLVLRHREPLKLNRFLEECKGRVPVWKGRRVLITLNTRRSAKNLRDGLVQPAVEAELPLELLSADVAPVDRLAAIERIKEGKPCLVVSTQCIEAGVDIDMELVLRDFSPLDSLIQVAGRCNRHGARERGTVEIVRLQDDERAQDLASYVYTDNILLPATDQVLDGLDRVDEEEVFPLIARYYQLLARKKDTGESVTRAWARWDEQELSVRSLLRGVDRPQTSFVVIDRDPGLKAELDRVRAIPDRWDRRLALRKLAARIARISVSVYQREGLDPADFAEPYPPGTKGEDAWFWLLRPGYYTPERGLDLGEVGQFEDSWGMIL